MTLLERTTRLLAATTAALVLAASASPIPAAAATVDYQDPRGDAAARWDLTRVEYRNGQHIAAITARVRGLRADGNQVLGLFLEPINSEASFTAFTVRLADGTKRHRLMAYRLNSAGRIRCRIESRWQIAMNRVIVRVPQACIDHYQPIRFSAAIGPGTGRSGDPRDWTNQARSVPYDCPRAPCRRSIRSR